MDWAGLSIVAFATIFGFVSWRWSVPYNVSFYKMVRAKEPDPASRIFRSFQFSRWAGVAFSVLLIVLVVLEWVTS
ncbi:hypothetical protein EFL26_03030 [Nocardioides pocheonensis]|jgi:hypothetical protein|uniref:Uncharacterized protein n=1 Tax=Nocardioides pocheonensis TaxID=661485 RepID=A0A3N0GY97_9ACTN|nr:hypothetical protein EFL26_03030 [Nocardioides pocheonensis]